MLKQNTHILVRLFAAIMNSVLLFFVSHALAQTPYEYCTSHVTEQINRGYAYDICSEADIHGVATMAADIYPQLHSQANIDSWTLAAFWVAPTALLKREPLFARFYEKASEAKTLMDDKYWGYAPSYAFYQLLREQPEFQNDWALKCRREAAPKLKLWQYEAELDIKSFLKAMHANSNYVTNAELMLQVCNGVANEHALDCVKTLHERRDKRYTNLNPSDFLALRACLLVETPEQNQCVKENLWPSFFWDFFSPVTGVKAMNIVVKCLY